MTTSEKPLGRHLPPVLDDARLERQVAAIAAAGAPRGRGRLGLLVVAGVAAALIVAWRFEASRFVARPLFTKVGARVGALPGRTLEAPSEPETLTLADGSRAVLDPHSLLTMLAMRAELVSVALERGGVELDVVHAEGKELVVLARGYEVRVLGTRFSVRLGGTERDPAVVVAVTRGRVRVTRAADDGDARVLQAGETWSAAPAAPTSAPAVAEPERAPPERPSVKDAAESARQLLARAETLRAANDPRGEARVLDALRQRHRGDPRAGLAAFELGRLRLDRLGDPRGAAEALTDALTLGAPSAPFREDAQARLVEAYAAAGERTRCLEAQATYLSRYARGLHRQKIASLCPE